MAILKKRTSSRTIPEARGLDRAPLDSVIRNFNDRPSLTGRPSGSITSDASTTGSATRPTITTGGGATRPPVTSTITNPTTKPTLPATRPTLPTKPPAFLTTKPTLTPKVPVTTKPTLTSKTTTPTKTTPVTKPTVTNKPVVTTKTSDTPTTKTTSPTSVVKPTVTPAKTNTNSTTNKVVNALTGAAIGAGTKLIFDKITGKPITTTTGNNTTGGTKPSVSGTTGGTKTPTGGTPTGGTKTPTGGTKTPPVTSKVLTDKEVQDELDKVKASEEPWTPPNGAIENADGTYTVIDGDIKTVYNPDGSVAGMEAAGQVSGVESLSPGETLEIGDGTTVTALDDGNGGIMYVYGGYNTETGLGPKGGVVPDNTDTTTSGTEYFQDGEGNYYTMNADGGYDLAYYADGTEYSPDNIDNTFADNTYTDPDTGAVWTMSDNGEWNTDFNYDDYYANQDTTLADNTDYTDNTDDTTLAYDDSGDVDYGAKGGLITMMKNGGVPHFEDGGDVYMPDGAEDNGDGTFTLGNDVYDMMTGDPLYSMNGDGNISYVEPSTGSNYTDNGDGTYTIGDITYDMETDMPLYSDNANGGVDLAKDNGDGTYTIGNKTYDMQTNAPLYTTNPRTGAINVNSDAIRSPGGGSRSPTLGNYLNKGLDTATGLGKSALDSITGALGTTAGAAGAGALIASLLGNDFGGGTGNQNQGLDMSKVGVINPRTTDFGIGPTNFVDYDQYGTGGGDYTPNEELLHNLNAPGYNPVNEGDYGYEDVPAEEEVPAMASGGLSSMSTPVASYYTFGQPADIMANLGMRPQPPMNPPDMMSGQPQQPQQQPPKYPTAPPQLDGQQSPLAMAQKTPQDTAGQQQNPLGSQGMPPQMRSGGLPHVSNVPIVQGRMDFRNGSAVHGEGDGQSDDIPAMLADGEYVIDAETVAQIGNGSTKAGAQALDRFREGIRAHKRSAPLNKIPPKTKALTSYLKGAK